MGDIPETVGTTRAPAVLIRVESGRALVQCIDLLVYKMAVQLMEPT